MLRSSFARHSKPGSVLSPKIIMARSEMNGNGCNIFARNVASQSKRWSDSRRIPLSVLLLVLPATLHLLRQPSVVWFHDSAHQLHAIPYNHLDLLVGSDRNGMPCKRSCIAFPVECCFYHSVRNL